MEVVIIADTVDLIIPLSASAADVLGPDRHTVVDKLIAGLAYHLWHASWEDTSIHCLLVAFSCFLAHAFKRSYKMIHVTCHRESCLLTSQWFT